MYQQNKEYILHLRVKMLSILVVNFLGHVKIRNRLQRGLLSIYFILLLNFISINKNFFMKKN